MTKQPLFTLTIASVLLMGAVLPAMAAADACGDPATGIHQIQGKGPESPLAGQTVSVEGIVTHTAGYQGGFSGFYLQQADTETDNNAATSEALFVYTRRKASPGQRLRLTGSVKEFHTLTELVNVSRLEVCGQAPLPKPIEVSLPWSHTPESLENMRVRFTGPLTVTDHYNLARFGELTLAHTDQVTPTEYLQPGPRAVRQSRYNAYHRVVLDDGKSLRNPRPVPWLDQGAENTIRSGDIVTRLNGVLDYRFNQWRVQPMEQPTFTRPQSRPAAPPPPSGSHTRIVALNLENYFNGNGANGGFPTPRGAESAHAHASQARRIASAISLSKPDILALTELENDGYSQASALAQLARTLGPQWRFIETSGHDGSDAIRTALLFRRDRVVPEGSPQRLTSGAYRHRGRPPLVQIFRPINGGKSVRVVVPHLKSKSCRRAKGQDTDQHDGQGCFTHYRTQEAQTISRWLESRPDSENPVGTLITGDLNSYARETPVDVLSKAGFVSLVHHFHPCQPDDCPQHSYRYRGEKGALDYALASPGLLPRVSAAQTWNINADEPKALDYQHTPDLSGPWRTSDHNPLIIDLQL